MKVDTCQCLGKQQKPVNQPARNKRTTRARARARAHTHTHTQKHTHRSTRTHKNKTNINKQKHVRMHKRMRAHANNNNNKTNRITEETGLPFKRLRINYSCPRFRAGPTFWNVDGPVNFVTQPLDKGPRGCVCVLLRGYLHRQLISSAKSNAQ